jgi:hypothetical protein
MAGFMPKEVFTDIDEIAHFGNLLKGGLARAEMRIDEFQSDLAKRRMRPGVGEKIENDLQVELEGQSGIET